MTNKEKLMMIPADKLVDLFDMENIMCEKCIARKVCKNNAMPCRETIIEYLNAEVANATDEAVDKLPEWVHPGSLVYDTRLPDGFRYRRLVAFDDVGTKDVNTCVFEARVRAMTSDELKELVGKVITFDNGHKGLCGFYEAQTALIGIWDTWYCSDDLLEKGGTVDGKPCKVFEHFEKGEWVK